MTRQEKNRIKRKYKIMMIIFPLLFGLVIFLTVMQIYIYSMNDNLFYGITMSILITIFYLTFRLLFLGSVIDRYRRNIRNKRIDRYGKQFFYYFEKRDKKMIYYYFDIIRKNVKLDSVKNLVFGAITAFQLLDDDKGMNEEAKQSIKRIFS